MTRGAWVKAFSLVGGGVKGASTKLEGALSSSRCKSALGPDRHNMESYGDGASQNWIGDESVLIGMSTSILKLMECFSISTSQKASHSRGMCTTLVA